MRVEPQHVFGFGEEDFPDDFFIGDDLVADEVEQPVCDLLRNVPGLNSHLSVQLLENRVEI